jgi:hypothetical protein
MPNSGIEPQGVDNMLVGCSPTSALTSRRTRHGSPRTRSTEHNDRWTARVLSYPRRHSPHQSLFGATQSPSHAAQGTQTDRIDPGRGLWTARLIDPAIRRGIGHPSASASRVAQLAGRPLVPHGRWSARVCGRLKARLRIAAAREPAAPAARRDAPATAQPRVSRAREWSARWAVVTRAG